MAIKIYEKFAPRANPADGDYPYGSIKNESVPGAKDGTPLDAVWGNDMVGFTDALLDEAGIVPNGNPDTVGASQRVDAIKLLSDAQYTTVSELATGKFKFGKFVYIDVRADGKFKIENTGSYVVNGFNILNAGSGKVAVLQLDAREAKVEWVGAYPDSTDFTSAINALIAAKSAAGGGIVTFNTSGTFTLGDLTFYDGVAGGGTIYDNEWNLFIAKDNITLVGKADVTLKAADGLVASNKDIGGTKGYSIIGGNGVKVQNFYFTKLKFDGNGVNNLVFPLNFSGAQAHATAYSFYEGIDNFAHTDCEFKNFPGANVGIVEWPSTNTYIARAKVDTVSDCIPGNVNIVDHSTFYTRCNNFLIEDCEVVQPTISIVSTAYECHGVGKVVGCKAVRTGTGGLSAGFLTGQIDADIQWINHQSYLTAVGLSADFEDNAVMNISIVNPKFLLRGDKRVAVGPVQAQAAGFNCVDVGTGNVQSADVTVVIQGGFIHQATPTGGWTTDDNLLNTPFRLTKLKKFSAKGVDIDGFKGYLVRYERQMNNQQGTVEIKGNTIKNCGYSQSSGAAAHVIGFRNGDTTDFSANLAELDMSDNTFVGCLYNAIVGTTSAPASVLAAVNKIRVVNDTYDTNVRPHEGGDAFVLDAWDWYFKYDVIAAQPTNSSQFTEVGPMYGEVNWRLGGATNEPLKATKLKFIPRWYFTRFGNADAPTVALPFGDKISDRKVVVTPISGKPLEYVCTVGASYPTLGTWVSVAVVP